MVFNDITKNEKKKKTKKDHKLMNFLPLLSAVYFFSNSIFFFLFTCLQLCKKIRKTKKKKANRKKKRNLLKRQLKLVHFIWFGFIDGFQCVALLSSEVFNIFFQIHQQKYVPPLSHPPSFLQQHFYPFLFLESFHMYINILVD